MKPLIKYENYRVYIRDFYTERKTRSGYTWRDFAKDSGYSSPIFLKLVCDGKTNLSEVGIERVAQAMGLVGVDLNFFRLLVAFNQEKDSNVKKLIFKEMRLIAKECSCSLVGEDQYDFYESWINPVVREIAPCINNVTPSQIADKLFFDKQTSDVKKALALLQKIGLLKKSEHGFEKTSKSITTGNIEVSSLSVREMHRQMGELAVRSLDEIPIKERDISGLTLGISENTFYRITKEIEEFRRRISSIVMNDSNENRVYRLNIQLFPLTKEFNGGNNA